MIGGEVSSRLCVEVGRKVQFVFHSIVFLILVEEAQFTFQLDHMHYLGY